jgi:phage shock protein PspC (stress-responsive transcriptional regulator)
MTRRLTRDTKNALLGGVAAGFANYFDVDPVLVRLVFILLAFLSGFGLVAYVVGWIIIPREGRAGEAAGGAGTGSQAGSTPADRIVETVREAGERVAQGFQRLPADAPRGRMVAGTVLIVLGVLFLLDRLFLWHWPSWARLSNLWPVILIVIGVSLILEGARGRNRKVL